MGKATEHLFATEVVASVLSNLPKEKRYLPTELRKIHPIFHRMCESGIGILRDFRFDKSGTFPYSQSVEQALSNLETSGILPRVNPDLDKYEIKPALKEYYKARIQSRLTQKQKKEIKEIANGLAKIALS